MRATLLLCLLPLFAACAGLPPPDARRQAALDLAATQGWLPLRLLTAGPPMVAFVPAAAVRADTLTVFIEGDGLAWLTPTRASPDPTPLDPLGLRLALAHRAGPAVYLARPCQFLSAERDVAAAACPAPLWLDKRFSEQAVALSGDAIDQLKQRTGARRLTLVGYSGGAAIAALLAARRDDVDLLVTIAGNLDTEAWTRHHRLSPLAGSLNPSDHVARLTDLRQVHLVGSHDDTIHPRFARAYAARFPPAQRPAVVDIDDADHRCCWVQRWPALWQQVTTTVEKGGGHSSTLQRRR